MTKRFLAAAIAGALLAPAVADAQNRVRVPIPNVELYATVKGKWVLDPRRCKDIREDIRDARNNTGRYDKRNERQDQRVAACPASSYDFVPDAGQGPKYPVRVSRGRVQRKLRGRPMFINGDTIGSDGRPIETPGQTYASPAYQQPTYQRPTYQQPTYQQPTYQQPTYQPLQQPTYQAPTPAPAPSSPSNYEVRNGVIYWLD